MEGISFMDKTEEITKRLHQGKTTREIAKELRVSLRDIHQVRKAEEIDFGALQRKENRLKASISENENALARLAREMATKQKFLENLGMCPSNPKMVNF
jgi:DNA-directed RNA polymerase specialized sigma subunit